MVNTLLLAITMVKSASEPGLVRRPLSYSKALLFGLCHGVPAGVYSIVHLVCKMCYFALMFDRQATGATETTSLISFVSLAQHTTCL